ncbi:serine hydrolase domain-containing protein [Aliikangiella sp. IMCC44359]|uniref:serine hydrolase domain-containing protein n=1 Tax=Aliikangiella sp. IMCC44359 TaxID=3459125 RepID=UPI00403AB830
MRLIQITINQMVISLFCIFTVLACGGDNSTTEKEPISPKDTSYLTAPQSNLRDWLKYDELQSLNLSQPSPYHNDYFMPIGNEEALQTFNGQLTFHTGKLIGFPSNTVEQYNQFPQFEASFVSHQGYLIPENRDIIIPNNNASYWRIILSPGKVWSETNDQGMSRASFPFVLVEHAWNTTLNGIATFLYDDNQVSNLRLQIVQHTAPGFIFEAAASIKLDYQPTPNQDRTTLISAFNQELEQRLLVESWQTLEDKFPNVKWDDFNSGIGISDISAAAIWHNNTLYMQNCHTQYGHYPYCRFMRHGIYSATKSAAGALALTYLAERYGIQVLDYLIKDYLEITATHDGWEQVTFRDALNMAVGIGNNDPNPHSNQTHADENQVPMGDWSRAFTRQHKLDIAFNQYGNYPWGPGEIFRYNTTHTFVLSAAMDSLVRQNDGIGLWQLLKDNVYQPIGIMHSPMMHTTEADISKGVPIIGVGLYPTVEDMIKIARLFHQQGQHNDQQLLNADAVNMALYRTAANGLPAYAYNNEFGEGRYLMSFWSIPYQDENGCFIQVPFMNGAGGNLVTILPNGVIGVRFSDANNYDAFSMVKTTASLAPVCE